MIVVSHDVHADRDNNYRNSDAMSCDSSNSSTFSEKKTAQNLTSSRRVDGSCIATSTGSNCSNSSVASKSFGTDLLVDQGNSGISILTPVQSQSKKCRLYESHPASGIPATVSPSIETDLPKQIDNRVTYSPTVNVIYGIIESPKSFPLRGNIRSSFKQQTDPEESVRITGSKDAIYSQREDKIIEPFSQRGKGGNLRLNVPLNIEGGTTSIDNPPPTSSHCSSSRHPSWSSDRNLTFATPLSPITSFKEYNERYARSRENSKSPLGRRSSPGGFSSPDGGRQFQRTGIKNDSKISFSQTIPTTATPPIIASGLSMTVMFVTYLCIVMASWWIGISPTYLSSPVFPSPWIGEHNATKLIDQRLQAIQNRFQKVLVADKWKMLRMSSNVTIETMSSEDGSWPHYIRTSAIFQAQPSEILKHLGWLQFDETQRKVDRFHESAQLLFAPSHKSKVIRKTTQRPLVFPKREMTVALCEKTLKQAFTLTNLKLRTAPMKTFTSILVPKGTSMNAMVNVNIDLDSLGAPEKGFPFWKRALNHVSSLQRDQGNRGVKSGLGGNAKKEWQKQRERNERHIKAYQDMMGWFIPLEGGDTLLVFVMQVDLGPDIPQWAFFTAVAATAAWSMAALNKLSKEK